MCPLRAKSGLVRRSKEGRLFHHLVGATLHRLPESGHSQALSECPPRWGTSGALGVIKESAVLAGACGRIRLVSCRTDCGQARAPPCCFACFVFSFSPPPLSSSSPRQRAPPPKRSNTPEMPSPAPSWYRAGNAASISSPARIRRSSTRSVSAAPASNGSHYADRQQTHQAGVEAACVATR